MNLKSEMRRNEIFTYKKYSELVSNIKGRGYIFAKFTEAKELLKKNSPFVLMRHDIDMDLQPALEIAKIEANLDVSSTFFFMLRTEHYNLFSKQGDYAISEILNLGHHLGLHFDCASYPNNISVEELAKACSKEVDILEKWFSKPVEIVSYHRPNQEVLVGNPEISAPRHHTYMPLYTKKIKYYSDSRGVWKQGNPLGSKEFKQKKPLHILIHPIWWNEHSWSPLNTLNNLVKRKNDQFKKSLAQNCKVFRLER